MLFLFFILIINFIVSVCSQWIVQSDAATIGTQDWYSITSSDDGSKLAAVNWWLSLLFIRLWSYMDNAI